MTSVVSAQSYPQFSQNTFNQLIVNPGYAGNAGMINLSAGGRNQWIGGFNDTAPITTVFGGDTEMNIFGWESGVGLLIVNDEIGEISTLNMGLNYAKRWEEDFGRLGVGISLGILNQKIGGSKFSSVPEGAAELGFNESAETFTDEEGYAMDLGIGAFLDNKKYFLGLSMMHLNNPEPKFKDTYKSYVGRTMFISGGYKYKLAGKPVVLVPSLFLKTNMSSYQIDVNTNAVFKDKYWGGLTYRLQDAVVVLAGVELNSGLRIGYSYDISISQLSGAKNGSHEIMLGYLFNLDLEKRKKQYKSVRYL